MTDIVILVEGGFVQFVTSNKPKIGKTMSKKIERVKNHHIGYRVEYQVAGGDKQQGTLVQIGKGARAGWLTIVSSGQSHEIHVDDITKLAGKFF